MWASAMKERLHRLILETKAWCSEKRGRQAELARHLGTSPQSFNQWLALRQDPPAHVALELQDFMRRQKSSRKARQNQEKELFVT